MINLTKFFSLRLVGFALILFVTGVLSACATVGSQNGDEIVEANGPQRTELLIGASSQDITPPLPVALDGQMHLRVAETVESPVTANIIALERRGADETVETSIWVSADIVTVPIELKQLIQQRVQEKIPDLDSRKIMINATHTHTAPAVRDHYKIPDGVTTVEETHELIADIVVKGIEEAWNNRVAGSVSWGVGHTKIAENRRAVYYDGSARMYGRTDLPEFRGIEGYEDNDVNTLFFWNDQDQLIATTINVSSPAQEVEGRTAVNADFFHPVRMRLYERFGSELVLNFIN